MIRVSLRNSEDKLSFCFLYALITNGYIYLQASANVVTVMNKGEWKGAVIRGGRCDESRWLIRKSFTEEDQASFVFQTILLSLVVCVRWFDG